MNLSEITPLVLTFNEAANLDRTLARLGWATRVVVLDSFSTDDTEAICRRHPQVDFVQRTFDDHTTQWNYGLDCVRSPWVLSLDADYVLTDDIIAELSAFPEAGSINGYFARFHYCVFGRRLRGSLYPPRVVLFRCDRGRYAMDGHTQRLQIEEPVGRLRGFIDHDDRKPLDRWFADQLRYAAQEARHLTITPASELSQLDRIRRRMVFAPGLVPVYSLFVQRLLLDGWPGWYYTLQRTVAELLLALRLVERRLRRVEAKNGPARERQTLASPQPDHHDS